MRIDFIKNITVWNVFKVSMPLMISALSSHLMLILDQLVLARYSIDAMTGASAASIWCGALQCAAMSITMIAGAFVGNYNGAKKFKLAGIPVWQMIWFSLSLFIISIPISMFAGEFCIPESLRSEGVPFFKILMFAAPISGVYYSLASFFVAIGRGILVTISAILANVVNVTIDIILVFGFFGIDGFQGSVGAAIGTVSAIIINTSFLLFCFFRKSIREKYKTLNFKLRINKLKECLKLGAAGGVGHIFEMSAWSIVYYLLATMGKEVAMIQSIAVSVNIFMAFIVSGLEKGVMAITANLLGAGVKDKIKILLKKALIIHFIFTGIAAIIFLFFPEIIINNFIKFDVGSDVVQHAILVLRLVLLYFLFDGVVWVIAGVIEAGGDISYTMITIATCLWIFVTIPSYILYKFGMLQVEFTWIMLFVAVVSISIILYHRYKSDKWNHIKI